MWAWLFGSGSEASKTADQEFVAQRLAVTTDDDLVCINRKLTETTRSNLVHIRRLLYSTVAKQSAYYPQPKAKPEPKPQMLPVLTAAQIKQAQDAKNHRLYLQRMLFNEKHPQACHGVRVIGDAFETIENPVWMKEFSSRQRR